MVAAWDKEKKIRCWAHAWASFHIAVGRASLRDVWSFPTSSNKLFVSNLSFFFKLSGQNSSCFIPSRCEMAWGACTQTSTCEISQSALLSTNVETKLWHVPLLTAEEQISHKNANVNICWQKNEDVYKQDLKIKCSACVCSQALSSWDAGRRIHPDCLELRSRHKGSRAHLRVKRPPAQSVSRGPNKERKDPGGYLIGMLLLLPPPRWGNMSSTQSFLK